MKYRAAILNEPQTVEIGDGRTATLKQGAWVVVDEMGRVAPLSVELGANLFRSGAERIAEYLNSAEATNP